jgi:hypothetical protein
VETGGGVSVGVGVAVDEAPPAGEADGVRRLVASAFVGDPASAAEGVADGRGLGGAEVLVGAARVGEGVTVHSGGRVGTAGVGVNAFVGNAARLSACVEAASAGDLDVCRADRLT